MNSWSNEYILAISMVIATAIFVVYVTILHRVV